MIHIEVQYFNGCPNSDEMIKRVREAITKTDWEVDYREILVDSPEKAHDYNFRGSPTVLVNGHDLEDFPEPSEGYLACRFYKNGIPSIDEIINRINMENNQ